MDCKSTSTPMITNLRKLQYFDTGSDLVDPTMYRQLIRSLMYMIHTMSDICYAVIAMSQFMTKPRQRHWVEENHILRYLRGTITYGLRNTSSGGLFLHGYANVDWAESPVDWKSTSEYCFSLGSAMISWSSWKHGSLHKVQQRLSTLQQVMLARKQYVSKNWFLGCLVTSSR